MSVFGPNQVEELIIGNAVATETTLATFISAATDKEIKILSSDGSAPAAGKNFKLFQKTAGSAAKGLNYEFSDVIKATKVKEVILKSYLAETLKSVTTSAFTATADTTYALEVRIFQDGGTLSPENFATVTGYYVINGAATGETATTVRNGVLASLNANLTRRGGGEVSAVANGAAAIDIVGIAQAVVPGKITGRQIEFDVTVKDFNNLSLNHENQGTFSVTINAENNPGVGTGKYAQNLEWFTKGYKYEAYRQTGYPADFTERTPFYGSSAGVYNVIHIKYFDDRNSPTIEVQEKVLTILVDKVTDVVANNAATNSVLADLRTILGSDNVPANLATT